MNVALTSVAPASVRQREVFGLTSAQSNATVDPLTLQQLAAGPVQVMEDMIMEPIMEATTIGQLQQQDPVLTLEMTPLVMPDG